MFERVFAVASNTFRETVRNKVLYVILAFALGVIGLSWFIADLSVGDFARIIANVGLAAVHIFGVIMAVFLGITLIHSELERRTVYLILAKPVRRWEFVVGKIAGLGTTLFITNAVMGISLFGIHAAFSGTPEPGILVASVGIYMELLLLTCVATLFSAFTTPVLSALFTLSFFVIGHVSGVLVSVAGAKGVSESYRMATKVAYLVLPNLEAFNWKDGVVYGDARSFHLVFGSVGYLASYGGAIILAAVILFSRKDFK